MSGVTFHMTQRRVDGDLIGPAAMRMIPTIDQGVTVQEQVWPFTRYRGTDTLRWFHAYGIPPKYRERGKVVLEAWMAHIVGAAHDPTHPWIYWWMHLVREDGEWRSREADTQPTPWVLEEHRPARAQWFYCKTDVNPPEASA